MSIHSDSPTGGRGRAVRLWRAHLGLHRHPVPAQFDRRDCAQPRLGSSFRRSRSGCFERVFSSLRRSRSRSAWRSTASAPGFASWSARHRHGRRRCVRRATAAARASSATRPARGSGLQARWWRRLPSMPPVSARSLCHAHRAADRLWDAWRSACDCSARLFPPRPSAGAAAFLRWVSSRA